MFRTRALATSALLVSIFTATGCTTGDPSPPFEPGIEPTDAAVDVDASNSSTSESDALPLEPTDARVSDVAPVDSTPTAPPPSTTKTEYAPYFYSWGWGNSAYPFTSLVDMQKKVGLNSATLAFVMARSGTCEVSRTIPNHLADIKAFRAAGGTVKASFGGASGTYLENACTTASGLESALAAFVDETDLRDLDFDVEQDPAMTATVNARRATALAAVQASRGVKIAFTLAVNPPDSSGKNGGLPSAGQAVLQSALAAGVVISHVNLMVMDYGSTLSSGRTMGSLAIGAIEATVKQLKTLMPTLTDAEGFAMIGATPMIGQNDVKTEVFGLADAKTLVDYAKSKQIGLVSFWAIQRDQPCNGTAGLDLCSMPGAPSYGFHSIFKGVL